VFCLVLPLTADDDSLVEGVSFEDLFRDGVTLADLMRNPFCFKLAFSRLDAVASELVFKLDKGAIQVLPVFSDALNAWLYVVS
jgi:hypothetical protein